jgi:hypothetical protein
MPIEEHYELRRSKMIVRVADALDVRLTTVLKKRLRWARSTFESFGVIHYATTEPCEHEDGPVNFVSFRAARKCSRTL